jgi:hypothetical protein
LCLLCAIGSRRSANRRENIRAMTAVSKMMSPRLRAIEVVV